MFKKRNIQVDSKHYKNDYDSLNRFISYYYQIESIIKLNQKTVLEVGIGNKTVSNYLKEYGLNVTTCDINKNLKPDKVGDIRKIPFKNNSFDIVSACELLEHIPFRDVKKGLSELSRVSKKYVVISIHNSCVNFDCALRISLLPLFNKQINFALRFPYFFYKVKYGINNNEHYWGLGRRYYPKRRIRKLISKYFNIKKEFYPLLNSFHYFFILEKKKI